MRLTHRALAALTALALCLLGGALPSPLFAVPAYAEEADAPSLGILASASPDEFVSPDETELTFQLTNLTGKKLEGVCLTSPDGLLVEPIGDIEPDGTLTCSRVHALTQAELDAGEIEYIVTCVLGSEHFSYPAKAYIIKASAEPEVEFLRRVSSLYVSDSNSITITYTIRNAGNVPVSAVSVTDPLGNFDGRLEMLGVGETKVFVQHVPVIEECVSAPTLTYSTESGEDVYTAQLDSLSLHPAHGMLDAVLTAGRSMFSSDTAEVILQLTNSGNIDYLGVTVYDDVYGGVIADALSIPAGSEPVEVARSYPLREDSSYRWRIVGRTSAGDQLDFITNTDSVQLDGDGGDALLTFRASTTMPRISRSGYVPIRLELTNVGDATAVHVQIREETAGDVCELAVVPTGDPTVRELRYEISQTSTLAFSAVYTDRYGKERIASAEPIEIVIGPGGQKPETDERPSLLFGGLATQMQNSGLFMTLLIGSCAVLTVLIVVLIIASRRAHIQRKARTAARRQRIREDMARTASFKPLRLRSAKKKDAKK